MKNIKILLTLPLALTTGCSIVGKSILGEKKYAEMRQDTATKKSRHDEINKLGLSENEVSLYETSNMSIDYISMCVKHGLNPAACYGWSSSFKDPIEAATWIENNFTVDGSIENRNAKDWSRNEFSATEALVWLNAGFTAENAAGWLKKGYNPEQANQSLSKVALVYEENCKNGYVDWITASVENPYSLVGKCVKGMGFVAIHFFDKNRGVYEANYIAGRNLFYIDMGAEEATRSIGGAFILGPLTQLNYRSGRSATALIAKPLFTGRE